MKAGIAMAVVGIACAATAGQSVTLHFDLDGDPFNTAEVVAGTEPVTWTVWASFTAPDPEAWFSGFVGSFTPDRALGGSVNNLSNLMAGEGQLPTVNGTAIENINIFNSNLISSPDNANPIALYSFDYQATASALTGPASNVMYTAIGSAFLSLDDNIFTIPTEFEDFAVVSDVLVVPGPGAAGGILLGVLAGRRRRAIAKHPARHGHTRQTQQGAE